MKADAGKERKFLDLNACLFTYLFTFAFNSGKIFSSSSWSCQTPLFISGHQSAKLGCNNFSSSWISLGPQCNAARMGEDPRGICEEEMTTLILQGRHHQLIPRIASGCQPPAPRGWSAPHRRWSCRCSPCLSEWRGHALPPRLLALPSALSCL